jgi:hypothetical protein
MFSLCSHEVKTPKRPIREAEARDFQRRFSWRAAIGGGLLAPAILANLVVMGTKSREQIDTLKNLIAIHKADPASFKNAAKRSLR